MRDQPKALECPSCLGHAATLLLRAHNGYPIFRCARCNLAFTDMRDAPPPAALYPEFDQSRSGLAAVLRHSLAVFARQREALVRSVAPSGRLLDFGCGSGAFARWMAAAGYDVVGLEPFSLGRPLQEDRLLLVREPLDSAAANLGHFDVITLWHVLEHLNRPAEVLKKLSNMLATGGLLIVSVPNFQSWQSRVFRGGWFHLDPPRHIAHFEAATLEASLRAAGLTTTKRWEFLPEYGSSGWLQSTLNRILPHSNYLYELVKDRGALKGTGLAAHGLHLSVSLLAGAPLLALSIPVEAVASSFGGGAAITVAAKRTQ